MADTDPQAERTDTNPKDTSTFWQVQLGLADKDQQDWEKDAKAVVDRYRAEKRRKTESRWFNILYSNTETLKSTLYGKSAKPDVRRRFADKDPAAREAAEVIERSLIYCAEQYDVDKCIEPGLHDYLLPGRGVVRIEYEPVIKEVDGKEVVADQVVRERYVYWEDYRQTPARKFEDVWWIAFRHIMTLEDLRDNNFQNPNAVPLNWEPNSDDKRPVPDELKKAEVWEIWDKSRRKRIWIVKGYPKPLRIDDDPYQLEGFYPMPEPIVSIQDTKTLVPQPEYHEYKDQAEDLDEIVGRISKLTRALKRRGVYDQAVKELKRLATANDNQFIPVENWAALSTKGGLQAAFQTEDISVIALVLKELYVQRDMLVQAIYELTGIADIMRGSSDPDETLGAQQLKAQFGSTRIKRRQRAVQKWIRDLYKIKAEIIAEHFEPQVLMEMTGVQISPEVMQILRSDKMRGYRIDIETDSTVFEDEATVKQQITELLTAIGQFIREGLPAAQASPELTPLLFEMMGVAVRHLKQGRQLEDVIEQTKDAIMQKVAMAQQNPQPTPEQQKLQAEQTKMQMEAQQKAQEAQQKAALEQQKMELEREKMANEIQFKQAELELKREEMAMKLQEMEAKLAMEREQAANDMQLAQMKTQHDVQLAEFKAKQDAEIAEREAEIKRDQMKMEGELSLAQGHEKMEQERQAFGQKITQGSQSHAQSMQHDSEQHRIKMEREQEAMRLQREAAEKSKPKSRRLKGKYGNAEVDLEVS
jgi:hypothetical protein